MGIRVICSGCLCLIEEMTTPRPSSRVNTDDVTDLLPYLASLNDTAMARKRGCVVLQSTSIFSEHLKMGICIKATLLCFDFQILTGQICCLGQFLDQFHMISLAPPKVLVTCLAVPFGDEDNARQSTRTTKCGRMRRKNVM